MITVACVLGNEIIDFDTVKEKDVESARIKLWNGTGDSSDVEFRYWRVVNGKIIHIPNRI